MISPDVAKVAVFRRLSILAAFFVANALPEFLWSNFPPIMTVVAAKYHLGEVAASLPVISFSVGTVLSAGIAGRLIDGRGYPLSMRVGLGLLAMCAVLRMLDGPFWLLVLAQGGIGAAFSFIVAATSSYVVDWFDERHEGLVTGICMIGLYAGLGSSMIVTPLLVEAHGFTGMMQLTALGAVIVFLVAAPLIVRRTGSPSRAAATHSTRASWHLVGNRTLRLQFIISFLQQGAFSAVATALEIAWSHRGLSPEAAGMANGLFIFGGIAGSFLMPLWQKRWHGKGVLVVCYLAALLLTYPLFLAPTPSAGYLIAMVMGLFWLGSVPVALTLIEHAAGTAQAGAASGLYWGFASAGSVGLVWLSSEITETWSWQAAAASTVALLAVNQIATFALPGDSHPAAN